MIVIFGPLSIDVHLHAQKLPHGETPQDADKHHIFYGGKTAAQAIAAARAGAKVTVLGTVGGDEYGTRIIEMLNKENVITSGIGMATTPTGLMVTTHDTGRQRQSITSHGANQTSPLSLIDKNFFNEKMIVLVQTGMDVAENLKILTMAKESGAMTMMNLAPYIDLSQKMLDLLDYLIVNHEEAEKLAAKLGLKVEKNAFQLAQGLSQQGSLNCIITLGAQGCIGVTRDNTGWSVATLPVEDKILDRNGAEDSYCGTLAAGIQGGLPLARAMKRACIAASLTCAKPGMIEAFPSKTDIDNRMNDAKDPEQQKLQA